MNLWFKGKDRRVYFNRMPLRTRFVRWLRFMPLAYWRAAFAFAGWAATGMTPVTFPEFDGIGGWTLSRRETAKLIWSGTVVAGECKMGICINLKRCIWDGFKEDEC